MADTPVDAATAHQRQIDEHFTHTSQDWKDLYEQNSLFGVIHQGRRSIALHWIDELAFPPGSRVLEVGCGAGLLAVDLARRGHILDCIDTSEGMVELARAQVAEAGMSDAATVRIGDAHSLQFGPNSHDVVIALGVLPFLHSPAIALREMARVVKPHGYVLLSSDNRFRLNHLIDPRFSPALASVKQAGKKIARRLTNREWGMPINRFSYRSLQQLLSDAGLTIVKCKMFGFGPFTLFGQPVLSDALGIRVHRRLQDLADRGTPVLRSTAAQHIVLARRAS